jgi:hypothetical protein
MKLGTTARNASCRLARARPAVRMSQIDRRGQRLCNRSASAKSGAYGFLVNSSFLGPDDERFCYAVKSQASIVTFVSALLFGGSPATVCRRITAACALALQTVFGCRSLTHIGKEVFKSPPTPAHADTSSAIVGKTFNCVVTTTLVHRLPSAKFLRTIHSVFCGCFALCATATCRNAGVQRSPQHVTNDAAPAATSPACLAAFAAGKPLHDPTPVLSLVA